MPMKPSSIFRSDLLAGQTVVVTGGGSGIGRAIAEEMARLGARVAIGARKIDRLKETAQAITADGGDVYYAPLDIRDETSVSNWVEALSKAWGEIHVLVNNAGGQFPSPAIAIRPKGWRAVVETNLTGTWLMTQAVAQRMMNQKRGKIINIVANMWRGFPGMAHTGRLGLGLLI